MNQFRCETCEYYPAGSIFDERCPYSEFTWRHAGNHPQCIKDPFLASEIWQVPIDVMSELTSFIGCVSHSDLQYQCGDNCKGECSGEVTGIPFCPQSERVGIDGLTDSEYEHMKLVQKIEILHNQLQSNRECRNTCGLSDDDCNYRDKQLKEGWVVTGRDKVLDELRVIKEYDRIRFYQKHTLPKSWVEVKVTSVSKDGKRIGISGKMPGSGCTTEMCIDISDVRQVCRWIELRQQAGEQ